ncbi:unnamed protein product, partial [Owenia fusiformis]
TIVVAERFSLDPWWPVLNTYPVSKIFLAGIGSKEALLYPSKGAFIKDQYGLKFNLWASECPCLEQTFSCLVCFRAWLDGKPIYLSEIDGRIKEIEKNASEKGYVRKSTKLF